MTELAGTQLSSLLETLPGIATVLRSPVADAIVNLVRAASDQAPFSMGDAEELMRYAIRRNLIAAEESERVLAETREALASAPGAGPAKPDLKPKKLPAPKLVAPKPVPPKLIAPKAVAPKPVAPKQMAVKKSVKPVKMAKPTAAKKKGKPARAGLKSTRAPHKKK
ncbi:MAG TPA: hypothetical protein VGA78_17900 [Gemmatimonadales bacterium]